MPSKKKLDEYYMSLALRVAELSHGRRARVGACLITDNDVTILSCNGLPKQLGNVLETVEDDGSLKSLSYVVHAETNAVLKCAKEGVSVSGATIFVTLSPCSSCAAMLASCGIKRVVYLQEYRDTKGIEVLRKCGIIVEKLEAL